MKKRPTKRPQKPSHPNAPDDILWGVFLGETGMSLHVKPQNHPKSRGDLNAKQASGHQTPIKGRILGAAPMQVPIGSPVSPPFFSYT